MSAQLGWGFEESAAPADTKPNPEGKKVVVGHEGGLPSLANQQRGCFIHFRLGVSNLVLVTMPLVGAPRTMILSESSRPSSP